MYFEHNNIRIPQGVYFPCAVFLEYFAVINIPRIHIYNVIIFMELNYNFDNSMKNTTTTINANKKINDEKKGKKEAGKPCKRRAKLFPSIPQKLS